MCHPVYDTRIDLEGQDNVEYDGQILIQSGQESLTTFLLLMINDSKTSFLPSYLAKSKLHHPIFVGQFFQTCVTGNRPKGLGHEV